MESLQKTTTKSVCKVFKTLFARYGVPDMLVTDNGPQFSSAEFATSAKVWDFHHQTSSPHYPQSNGKAENAVKTIKRLSTKCRESGHSEFRALLDLRNTPSDEMGTSPAQRFLGRRCRTLLPITNAQLVLQYSTREMSRALAGQMAKQQHYYDKHTKNLPRISAGDTVRMRLPGQKNWMQGVCKGLQGPRSYGVSWESCTIGIKDNYCTRRSHSHWTYQQGFIQK